MDEISKLVVSELSIEFRTSWDLYIKFYTAFLVFNITGLGLVAEKVKSRNAQFLIAAAFVLQNVLSACTAAQMANYSRSAAERVQSILVVAIDHAAKSTNFNQAAVQHLKKESPFPGELGFYAGWANGVSHVFMILAWIAVLAVKSRESQQSQPSVISSQANETGEYGV